MIDLDTWDLAALARLWRCGRPFPHVVIDDLVSSSELSSLCAAFDEEPASEIRDDIFQMMASARSPESAPFKRFATALERPEVLAAVRAITALGVHRVDARAFAYLPGHYLLPHADLDAGRKRLVAYAFYIACDDLEGGELELFDCEVTGEDIVATHPGPRLSPVANRLVLFAVTPSSLHRVREVTNGARLSIAGWFSS